MFSVLFLGDVVGRVGRKVLRELLPQLKSELNVDYCIVNSENSAGGLGVEPTTADEIFKAGADFQTTGNHIWNRKSIIPYLDNHTDKIIRPGNYQTSRDLAPAGVGHTVVETSAGRLLICNLMGRVFMGELLDCPFKAIDDILETEDFDISFLDFHAEATSEKVAMGHHVDGRVNMVVGTHTHIQTADEKILPGGTGYITDVGMCGPYDSVIGVKKEDIVHRFRTGLPTRFDTAKGRGQLNGIVFRLEDNKVIELQRVNLIE